MQGEVTGLNVANLRRKNMFWGEVGQAVSQAVKLCMLNGMSILRMSLNTGA